MGDFDLAKWFPRNWGWVVFGVLSPLIFALPPGLWPFVPITALYVGGWVRRYRVERLLRADMAAVLEHLGPK